MKLVFAPLTLGLLLLAAGVAGPAQAAGISTPSHADNVGNDDGISRPDYSRYKNLAYPQADVDNAQSAGARQAFKAIAAAASHGGSWALASPTVNPVPALVTYTNRATNASGRVTALALTPGCRDDDFGACRVFLGAAGGGVWVADHPFSGTLQWRAASTGLDSNAIGSLLVDPKGYGLVAYAGTGEQNSSGDSEAGVGLYKTVDGGKTWQVLPASVPLASGLSIASIAIDPRDSRHLYFGTMTALHGAAASANASLPPSTANLGLYESRDGGTTFTRILNTAPGSSFTGGVMDIQFDPNDPDTVYLSIFGYGIVRASPRLDGTAAFLTVFATGQPNDGFNRLVMSLAKLGKATRVYVGDSIDAPGTSYLYRVDNARVPASALYDGTSNLGWTALSDPTPGNPGYSSYGFCQGQCFYDIYVASPPGRPDTVYIGGSMNYPEIFGQVAPASNGRAVMRSTNAGVSFTDMTRDARSPSLGMHPDQHAIVFNPRNPDQILAGSDGGLVRTSGSFVDASAGCAARGLSGPDLTDCLTWLAAIPTLVEPENEGLASLQFQSIAFDPRDPLGSWIGGTQDNGTWAFGTSGAPFFETIGGDGGTVGIDAADSNIRFHTYYAPQIDVNFQGALLTGWDWVSDPLLASGEAYEFYPPTLSDPKVGGTMFIGLQHVWRTQDSGGPRAYLDLHCNEYSGDFKAPCGDWVPLGDDLTLASAQPPLRDRAGGEVALVARSQGDSGTLWTGTSRGRLFVSSNADAADPTAVVFTRIDDSTASPSRVISGIAIDPADGHHAFVAYTGYGAYTPYAPGHVYEVTVDRAGTAASFQDLSYNLGDLPVTALVRDARSGTLYAGTDFGVLVLAPGSRQWQALGQGLPPTAVYQLALSEDGLLYAATHGRGMWRLQTR